MWLYKSIFVITIFDSDIEAFGWLSADAYDIRIYLDVGPSVFVSDVHGSSFSLFGCFRFLGISVLVICISNIARWFGQMQDYYELL